MKTARSSIGPFSLGDGVVDMTGSDESILVRKMESQADWDDLEKVLDPVRKTDAVFNTVRQLRDAGIKSIVIENDYLDRDFSEEYTAFYAKLFRRHRRHARRMHFFTSDVSQIVAEADAAKLIGELEREQREGHYAGFLVWRPMAEAPIGRAVLSVFKSWPEMHGFLQVRATYETHLLGARLSVSGVPFMQQDKQFTACSQVSLWAVGRHFSAKHGGAWISPAKIAATAFEAHDVPSASSLPAGSRGLTLSNMVAALRRMDLQPVLHHKRELPGGKLEWPAPLVPAAIVARYVESGLPVLLGLHDLEGTEDFHVVVVTGTAFRELENCETRSQLTIADFIPFFLVQDDRLGTNRWMPAKKGNSQGAWDETPYNLEDNVSFILAPLPQKVFVTAELAERYSLDIVEQFYMEDWASHRTGVLKDDDKVIAAGDAVAAALKAETIVARTYLRPGWKYKKWLTESQAHNDLKLRVVHHELPRLVWVTELGLASDVNHMLPSDRRIFGHVVYDATAAGQVRQPLLMHLPGMLYIWEQSAGEFYVRADHRGIPLRGDVGYAPRFRT